MTRLRIQDYRLDIFSENEFRVRFSVKDKIELDLRMSRHNATQSFVSHPTDAFEPVFQQQTCIYCYFQINQIKTQK